MSWRAWSVAIVVSLSAVAVLPSGGAPAGAIVGGEPADLAEYPWTVALVEPGEAPIDGQFCGGSLVAPDWVLTAAHCASGGRGRPFTPDRIDVLAGRADLARRGGRRVDVTEVRIDPEREDPRVDIDLALLHLAEPLAIQTVALPGSGDPSPAPGTEAQVLGWGVTTRGDDREVDRGYSSDELRVATVPIVADRRCRRTTDAEAVGVGAFELCAGDGDGRGGDSCLGDSGGPLVVATPAGWVQVGVVAWSAGGCGLRDSPGVYTRVAHSIDWIRATIDGSVPG